MPAATHSQGDHSPGTVKLHDISTTLRGNPTHVVVTQFIDVLLSMLQSRHIFHTTVPNDLNMQRNPYSTW